MLTERLARLWRRADAGRYSAAPANAMSAWTARRFTEFLAGGFPAAGDFVDEGAQDGQQDQDQGQGVDGRRQAGADLGGDIDRQVVSSPRTNRVVL